MYSHDGLVHKTTPIEYRVTATGIDLKLTKDIDISFYYSQGKDNNINISLTSGDPASIKNIELPITSETAQFSAKEEIPVVSITSEYTGNFFLSLPETSALAQDNDAIIIYPKADSASLIVFERAATAGIDAFTYWLKGNTDIISGEKLSSDIDSYLKKSSSALMGSRFNPTRGSWTTPDGRSEFNEQALVMAASEYLGTPQYSRIKEQLDRTAASNSRKLSLLSSSLFGNIVNTVWAYDQNLLQTPTALNRTAKAFDFSVFESKDLLATILTGNSDRLLESLVSLSSTVADSEITLNQAVAMLSFYNAIIENAPKIGARFSDLTKIIETYILPALEIIDNHIYIIEEKDVADLTLTLKTGFLLMQVSTGEKAGDYIAIGRELINSALLLSDDNGFIPERIKVTENNDVISEGYIAPEEIYPILNENKYYPEEDFFFAETGKKISARNQAEDFQIEITDLGYKLTFKFPAGQTHTFAIRNIEPFAQVNMLGYKWNSDHRFLTYSSGWWYDKQHNTMFVKIKHRQETEEILIFNERQPEEEPIQAPTGGTDQLQNGLSS